MYGVSYGVILSLCGSIVVVCLIGMMIFVFSISYVLQHWGAQCY